LSKSCSKLYNFTDFTEVSCVISNLKPSSSCGLDQIPVTVIKSVNNILSHILVNLINHSFTNAIFPDALKSAKIIPIFKSGDKTLINNYRPISLLNSFSKIYEKIFLLKLNSFLMKHNILNDSQYGFQKNKSTQHALISFVDTVTEALERNHYVIILFLDLSKAFETVDHAILLKKLYSYGIRGVALDLIASYLSNRTQCVEIDGVLSSTLPVTCGVPQGSTLGPILFLLYINDLFMCSKILKLLLFADDTTIILTSNDINTLISTVNTELAHLLHWFNRNKLSLNPDKSNYMIFNGHKKLPRHGEIIIGNQIIRQVNTCKFLGVEIDCALKWLNHIRQIESRISSAIFVIRNIRYKINRATALKLYDNLVFSHLIYCNILWGNTYKSYLMNLYRLQKRALRLCSGENNLSSEKLFIKTDKLPLFNIHDLFTAQLIYKYFNTPYMLPRNIISLFSKNSETHRFHTRFSDTLTLHTQLGKLNARSNSIKIFGAFLWNKISLNIRLTSTLHAFKKSYKTFLLNSTSISAS